MSWEGRGKGTQVGGINNQDSIIASSLEESILFGVFDGHGEFGGEASNFVVDWLPSNVLEVEPEINAAGMDAASAQPALESAYAKTHQQLLEQTAQGGFDTFLSGSTCITVLVGLLLSRPAHSFLCTQLHRNWVTPGAIVLPARVRLSVTYLHSWPRSALQLAHCN